MPGCSIHFQLALGLLDQWDRAPENSPFAPTDSSARNSFLNGCNGPDMGYYPGGDALLTDCAHYIRSADLARALVGLSRTATEKAFAWGWVTHILADASIHPIVNRAVGEMLHADRNRAVPYADDPVSHVRVEIGLDADFLVRHPASIGLKTSPVFNERSVEYLRAAYRETYGLEFDPSKLLASHRAVARYTRWMLKAEHLIGTRHQRTRLTSQPRRMIWLGLAATRILSTIIARKTFWYGVTHTIPPLAWMVEEVEKICSNFKSCFDGQLSADLKNLPQYNLDTGVIEGDASTYPLAEKARLELSNRISKDAASTSRRAN